MTLDQLKVTRDQKCDQDLKELRALLPGQVAMETQRLAEAQFGLSYTASELHDKIVATLPLAGRRRLRRSKWVLEWRDADTYSNLIPECALERFQEALTSNLFTALRMPNKHCADEVGFFVIEPRLEHRNSPTADPWLVGKIKGTNRFIVLAYWE